jgi:UDP-3-O-[3-hydroxymyristoyl] glucosamine N-acyltransferase
MFALEIADSGIIGQVRSLPDAHVTATRISNGQTADLHSEWARRRTNVNQLLKMERSFQAHEPDRDLRLDKAGSGT